MARHWATSASATEKDDLLAFGADKEVVDAKQFEEPVIHQDNFETVKVFFALSGSWRFSPQGRPQGIDFTQAISVLAFLQIPPTEEIFTGLKIMESAALSAFSEQYEENR